MDLDEPVVSLLTDELSELLTCRSPELSISEPIGLTKELFCISPDSHSANMIINCHRAHCS